MKKNKLFISELDRLKARDNQLKKDYEAGKSISGKEMMAIKQRIREIENTIDEDYEYESIREAQMEHLSN